MDSTVRRIHKQDSVSLNARAYQYITASRTHVGMIRQVNEDAYLDHADFGLWAVADGLGGHQAGDFASHLTVASLAKIQRPVNAVAFMAEVKACLEAVNRQLRNIVLAERTRDIVATTIVVLLIFGRHYACTWVGDSRLYLIRQSQIHQITRDHSQAQLMADAGLISNDTNIITRAIGARDELELDMVQGEVLPGDIFLLCSDGLTKMLSDTEIVQIATAKYAKEAVDLLIETSLRRGAIDNVTAVMVIVDDREES